MSGDLITFVAPFLGGFLGAALAGFLGMGLFFYLDK